MAANETNEQDLIDIQDRLGYVDTGPITEQPSYRPYPATTVASNSHLIIKEPVAQRQIQLPADSARKRSSKPEIQQQEKNKLQSPPSLPPTAATAPTTTTAAAAAATTSSLSSFHNPTRSSDKKSNSLETTAIPYPFNVPYLVLPQQPKLPSENKTKGKEKLGSNPEYPSSTTTATTSTIPASTVAAATASKFANMALPRPPQSNQDREQLKDLFISKYIELAKLGDMLQAMDISASDPSFDRMRASSHREQPRPTPSKSDPNYPRLHRKVSRGRMNGYSHPSPETNRQTFNKSADMAMNYQEPNNHPPAPASAMPANTNRGVYSRDYATSPQDPGFVPHTSRSMNVSNDHHYNYSPQQNSYYNTRRPDPYEDQRSYYVTHNEEPFMGHDEYYRTPRMHSQHRVHEGRQRRKSYGNLHDEAMHTGLNRKGSRGALRRLPAIERRPAMLYDYPDIPLHYPYGEPSYYSHQKYSGNAGGYYV